jgi:hypothetical protein
MVTGILQNTPYWVWGIFVLLLVLGLLQTRTRNVSRALVFVLPLIMIPLSFSTIATTFGIKLLPVISWAAGIAASLALNSFLFRAPAGVRYQAGKFEIPGSWIPLILMMTIFLARFVIGVTRAVNPALVGSDAFAAIVSAILGFCSGLFAARAIKILSAQRAAAR